MALPRVVGSIQDKLNSHDVTRSQFDNRITLMNITIALDFIVGVMYNTGRNS